MTPPLDYMRAATSAGEPWCPIGDGWRSPCNSWLVAHDQFHHLPGDVGSLCEELATLGAEYYVCHEPLAPSPWPGDADALPPPGLNSLVRSAAGIVGMAFESEHSGAEEFVIRQTSGPRVPGTTWNIFTCAGTSAAGQLRELVEGTDDPEWLRALESFEAPNVAASWIAAGYSNAQARFSSQADVRAKWEQAVTQLRDLEKSTPHGAILTTTLRESGMCFEVDEAQGRS